MKDIVSSQACIYQLWLTENFVLNSFAPAHRKMNYCYDDMSAKLILMSISSNLRDFEFISFSLLISILFFITFTNEWIIID